LVLLEIEFPFTHDLDQLRNLIPTGWHVKTEFSELAELTIWSIEARYPGDMPSVVEGDARNALQTAEAMYRTVASDWQAYILE
jgi:HEPN domain-containing protein